MLKNSALLVTSAQKDLMTENGKAWGFTKESIQQNNVVSNIEKVVKKAREIGLTIIHSPVAFDYEELKDFDPLTSIQSVIIENKLLEVNTTGSEFIDEASPLSNEIVLPNRQGFSSFWAKTIQSKLEEMKINSLYIVGMLAEGCVESHARDAAENGFRTNVITDAIGSTSLELLEASLKTLALHTSSLMTTQEFIDSLK
jgi:nicotinamidase-related amidase